MSDCTKCDQCCCFVDAWKVGLTPAEAKVLPHVRLPNGQYVIAANSSGYCGYLEEGKCTIYDRRPKVCRDFDCDQRQKDIEVIRKKVEQYKQELESEYCGYMVAFIYKATNDTKTASELVIKNEETGKEIRLTPTKVFGRSEVKVKEAMIDIIKSPFKPESI